MSRQKLTLISVTPPTPNGDLHVGHLSGPYLAADVFRRYNRLRSLPAVSAFSSDVNQTYVVTTAERLRLSPSQLAIDSHESISHTLDLAEISFDLRGFPDRAYAEHLADHFVSLNRAGAFSLKEVNALFHRPSGRYMFEAYAQGRCNVCLAVTKGNICENCGHPNDPIKLLNLQAAGYFEEKETFEPGRVSTLVLEVERYRERIERHLRTLQAPMRPELANLCKTILSERLCDFPITFRSEWGISGGPLGLAGTVINVWAEMQPGHVYWFSEAWKKSSYFDGRPLNEKHIDYVQFLGFDNSYFYVFAHLALAFAAQDAGLFAPLPSAFITNEFLQLENYKFSTSQGHLIWARDLLKTYSSDEVRFYLSWSSPEHQKANFIPADMEAIVESQFRKPIKVILDWLERNGGRTNDVSVEPEASIGIATRSALVRFESAYNKPTFSLRRAAQTIADLLDWCVQLAARTESGSVHDFANFKAALDVAILGLAPIAPNTSAQLWKAATYTETMTWN